MSQRPEARRPTLLEVHAHPDDESITSGGLFAWCAERGILTVLVTCTGGEVGEIVDPTMDKASVQPQLASLREDELRQACGILGIEHLELLGYRDSGMADTPDNEHPHSFARADLEEATARLVRIFRSYRPDVVVTYDENGGYGHPDHIKAHRITVRAFDLAADAKFGPELGGPWQPAKLYYTALPRSRLRRLARELRSRGIKTRWDDVDPDKIEFGTPDERVTTTVDVRRYAGTKMRAMLAHRTQIDPAGWMLNLSDDLRREIWGWESFTRVRSSVDAPLPETDLLAGLPLPQGAHRA